MTKLTEAAETVLSRRYYLKDEKGNPVEDWADLCNRVAMHVGQDEESNIVNQFFGMIHNLDFLPNSPCLMNAGTELGQLSACFVLPVEDSMDGIFSAVRNGALVHKTGGGTGYSFSRLRPKGSSVLSTQGVASGPLSFLEVFNTATETIKQGGKRRGANMAVLDIEHPDIEEFIKAKEDPTRFTNFNFSVAITDGFMEAVTNPVIAAGEALHLFDLIVDRAWRTGEPGVIFIDQVNDTNPTPWLGKIEASNPCGEQFLLPFESCNLGSINLGNFIRQGRVDYDRLEEVVCAAVHFLDNVVDCTTFPIPEIAAATMHTRKLGLGIMGLHDMLIQMGMPYASEVGRAQAAEVMSFIQKVARLKSEHMAMERGLAPAFEHAPLGHRPAPQRANVTLTSIQPTGTVSMIADCSSGCEPYFSLVMVKNVMDGDRLLMVNKHFERVARAEGFYSEALMERVAERGTVVGDPEVPLAWQEVFRCAQDIGPMDHIGMQAVLQSYVDSGISKTINMPSDATREEVRLAYVEAWHRGCKGLTVYRDGCRANQVLNVGKDKLAAAEQSEVTPATKAPAKLELPDVVDAKRYRLQGADGENMYIIVCTDNGVPVEVFAKFPADNRVELRDKSTMWTVTCRLASLALRHRVPMEEVIKQLDRSSGYLQDLPTQLAKLLKSFISDNGGEYSSACPDCGGRMVFQEGCETCAACGFSKCS